MWQFRFTAASYFPGGIPKSEFVKNNDYMRVKIGEYLLFRRWENTEGYTDKEPRLLSFFFAKVRAVKLPKYGFFCGEQPGALQLELPSGKTIWYNIVDRAALEKAFEENLLYGFLKYNDYWSAVGFDSRAELAETMDELNGMRSRIEYERRRHAEEAVHRLEQQRRAEQAKEAERQRRYGGASDADIERRFRGR